VKLLPALLAAAALAVAVSPASHAAGPRFLLEVDGKSVAFIDATMVYGSVNLVHGSASPELLALVQSGKRSDPDVVMLNADGAPVARYHLMHAWPSKLEIGALTASKNEVSVETLTLSYEGIQRIA
jgi:tail tube protein gp19